MRSTTTTVESPLPRDRFINGPLLAGLDLRGRRVLEAHVRRRPATQTLLDRWRRGDRPRHPDTCIESFRRNWPTCEAACASIAQSGLPSASFDAVVVVGGLHHLQPNLEPAFDRFTAS